MATICTPCRALQMPLDLDGTAWPETCWCCHASPVVLSDDDDDAEED